MGKRNLNPEQVCQEIINLLANFTLKDQIAIIANTIIFIGFEEIGVHPDNRLVTEQNVFETLMKHKHVYGETIGGALVHQGLVMLHWLNKRTKKE